MIGIFLKREEKDKLKEWQTLHLNKEEGNFVVADFICPTPEARSLFPADLVIWVDTIKEGRFDDTNKMFVKPDKYDFHVTTQDAKNWAPKILKEIK
jgi:adenylylsulfate kinase